MKKLLILGFATALAAIIAACGGGGGSSSNDAKTAVLGSAFTAPLNAQIVGDKYALAGQTITLDGSKSQGNIAEPLSYKWIFSAKPSGSKSTIVRETTSQPAIYLDIPGTYTVQLRVSDSNGNSNTTEFTLIATSANSPPNANAGASQSVVTGQIFFLDGTKSTDPNGDKITYLWLMISRPTGSKASISGVTDSRPNFTPDIDGQYVFQLQVNDGSLSSENASVTITAKTGNLPPVAVAGQDKSGAAGLNISLDGTQSTDPNGDSITYSWRLIARPIGSAAGIANPAFAKTTFIADLPGLYVASLTVSDGTLVSTPSTVNILVTSGNAAPTANAGNNQNVLEQSTVNLDGTQSLDPNGDAITYAWTMTSRPSNSTAALSNSNSAKPSFAVDKTGTYVISLVVSDGALTSLPSTVTVTVYSGNAPPTAVITTVDYSVFAGGTIRLDGRNSTDPNGDPISYKWVLAIKPVGSAAYIDSPTSPSVSFVADLPGEYGYALTVTDTKAAIGLAQSTSYVTDKPVIIARPGQDQTVFVSTSANLDARSSTIDNTIGYTVYDWKLVSKPAGSTISAVGSTSLLSGNYQPSFVPDAPGTYVISLTIYQGSNPTIVSNTALLAITAVNPPKLDLQASASKVAAGSVSQYAIKSNGLMYSWGSNKYGTLGTSSYVEGLLATTSPLSPNGSTVTPVQVIGSDYVSVSAGDTHVIALKSDGSLWAWGSNEYGQLGDGSNINSAVPKKIGVDYAAISASSRTSYAVKKDGTLQGWGILYTGPTSYLFGGNTVWNYRLPTQLNISGSITFISAGRNHLLALKSDGSLWSTGDNYCGQLGNGAPLDGNSDNSVRGTQGGQVGSGYKSISAWGNSSSAVRIDGSFMFWGQTTGALTGEPYYGPANLCGLLYATPTKFFDGYQTAFTFGMASKPDGSTWSFNFNPIILFSSNFKFITRAPYLGLFIGIKSDDTVYTWAATSATPVLIAIP